MKYQFPILAILLLLFIGCSAKGYMNTLEVEPITMNYLSRPASGEYNLNHFLYPDEALIKQVDELFEGLSDEERAGQLVMIAAGKNGKAREVVTRVVREGKAGGIILLGGTRQQLLEYTTAMDSIARGAGHLPLMIATDAEPSLIKYKIYDLGTFPNTNTLETEEKTAAVAAEIAQLLRDNNIQINFAPLADFSLNQEIIGNRAFGSDPAEVAKLAVAFIHATQAKLVAASAKHFPGHGMVKGDSHKQLVYVDGELQELEPFQAAIDAGVAMVMVGHIAVRNNEEWGTDGMPSTISRKIVTDLLKKKMGFKGIAVTDAMEMKGVSSFENAALKALQAGNDLILMPDNEDAFVQQVVELMKTDEAFRQQVTESVKKIIRLKICLGLID